LAIQRPALQFFSSLALAGAMVLASAATTVHAAQLIMFEQAGCSWCEAFDREIGTVYAKTDDGLRAPLRRLDIAQPLPPDLSFVQIERLTPLFVLVDKGREIGRIRGYAGRESFWTQLFVLMQKLDRNRKDAQSTRQDAASFFPAWSDPRFPLSMRASQG
jgi:hypothetical protein